ncbi:MAG: Rrf2 family transcriptional regulator [Chloroflexi bacterium]|nr:Rrf2 family transcriptional regulator [Chloroflexota bacterium]
MKISMKGDYGLRAIIHLGLNYGSGPVQSSDIAARQSIPEPYLDQLLTTLRRAGLIRSVRGPQGGHYLARPPESITVGEVITALEGSVAPIDCVQEKGCCSRAGACVQRDIWMEIDAMTKKVLDSTTIAALLERQAARESETMYYI